MIHTNHALNNAKTQAISQIQAGAATCIVVKHNRIISSGSPRGIAHVIHLYKSGTLKNAFVADKIIGKAAAMLFTLGGVKSCYGENVSQSAVLWLREHNVEISYSNCSEYIVNRKGDGMCPMETVVKDLHDENEALIALTSEIAKNSQKNKDKTKKTQK